MQVILYEALLCYKGHYFTSWVSNTWENHETFVQWVNRAPRVIELEKSN